MFSASVRIPLVSTLLNDIRYNIAEVVIDRSQKMEIIDQKNRRLENNFHKLIRVSMQQNNRFCHLSLSKPNLLQKFFIMLFFLVIAGDETRYTTSSLRLIYGLVRPSYMLRYSHHSTLYDSSFNEIKVRRRDESDGTC